MQEKMRHTLKCIGANLGLCKHSSCSVKLSKDEDKAEILREYNRNFGVFIETGTREGDMLSCLRNDFKRIYTIELDHDCYERAKKRFASEGHIVFIEGDSGEKINDILAELNEPALFWLDAHGSTVEVFGEHCAPILKELEAIFSHAIRQHVILIDDARHFSLSDQKVIQNLARKNNFSFFCKKGLYVLLPQ